MINTHTHTHTCAHRYIHVQIYIQIYIVQHADAPLLLFDHKAASIVVGDAPAYVKELLRGQRTPWQVSKQ